MATRLIKGMGLVLVLFALGGCAHASNCAGWSEIRPSKSDKLSDGTTVQILSHNLQGEQQGCWRR